MPPKINATQQRDTEKQKRDTIRKKNSKATLDSDKKAKTEKAEEEKIEEKAKAREAGEIPAEVSSDSSITKARSLLQRFVVGVFSIPIIEKIVDANGGVSWGIVKYAQGPNTRSRNESVVNAFLGDAVGGFGLQNRNTENALWFGAELKDIQNLAEGIPFSLPLTGDQEYPQLVVDKSKITQFSGGHRVGLALGWVKHHWALCLAANRAQKPEEVKRRTKLIERGLNWTIVLHNQDDINDVKKLYPADNIQATDVYQALGRNQELRVHTTQDDDKHAEFASGVEDAYQHAYHDWACLQEQEYVMAKEEKRRPTQIVIDESLVNAKHKVWSTGNRNTKVQDIRNNPKLREAVYILNRHGRLNRASKSSTFTMPFFARLAGDMGGIVCTIIAAGGKLVDLLQYRDHDLTEAFPDIATITRMTKKADPDLMARLIQQIREERSLEYIQPGAAEMTAMWESLDNCWMQSIGNVEEFGGNRQDEAWGTWATSIENAINGASKCTYATPEGVRRVVFALLHLDDFRGLPFPTPRAVERVMSAVEKCRYGISEVGSWIEPLGAISSTGRQNTKIRGPTHGLIQKLLTFDSGEILARTIAGYCLWNSVGLLRHLNLLTLSKSVHRFRDPGPARATMIGGTTPERDNWNYAAVFPAWVIKSPQSCKSLKDATRQEDLRAFNCFTNGTQSPLLNAIPRDVQANLTLPPNSPVDATSKSEIWSLDRSRYYETLLKAAKSLGDRNKQGLSDEILRQHSDIAMRIMAHTSAERTSQASLDDYTDVAMMALLEGRLAENYRPSIIANGHVALVREEVRNLVRSISSQPKWDYIDRLKSKVSKNAIDRFEVPSSDLMVIVEDEGDREERLKAVRTIMQAIASTRVLECSLKHRSYVGGSSQFLENLCKFLITEAAAKQHRDRFGGRYEFYGQDWDPELPAMLNISEDHHYHLEDRRSSADDDSGTGKLLQTRVREPGFTDLKSTRQTTQGERMNQDVRDGFERAMLIFDVELEANNAGVVHKKRIIDMASKVARASDKDSENSLHHTSALLFQRDLRLREEVQGIFKKEDLKEHASSISLEDEDKVDIDTKEPGFSMADGIEGIANSDEQMDPARSPAPKSDDDSSGQVGLASTSAEVNQEPAIRLGGLAPPTTQDLLASSQPNADDTAPAPPVRKSPRLEAGLQPGIAAAWAGNSAAEGGVKRDRSGSDDALSSRIPPKKLKPKADGKPADEGGDANEGGSGRGGGGVRGRGGGTVTAGVAPRGRQVPNPLGTNRRV